MCVSGGALIVFGVLGFIAFMAVVFESDGRKWDNGKWQSWDTYYRKERDRQKAEEMERLVKRWG